MMRKMFRTELPRPTDRLPLGGSGLAVSPVCLGMVDDPDAVLAAYDAGVNFFFVTCDMHWPLYESLRQGLTRLLARGGDIRDRIVVAGVTYVAQPPFLKYPFTEMSDAIPGLDRVDVLVAGGAYQPDTLPRLHILAGNRDEAWAGARAIGASFHDRDAARYAIAGDLLDIAFIRYNAGHPGAINDVFPYLERPHRALVYGFKSASGHVEPAKLADLGVPADLWRPDVFDHYRFALTRPQMNGILCSPSTPAEVRELVEALEQGALSEADEQYLIKLALLASGDAEIDHGD